MDTEPLSLASAQTPASRLDRGAQRRRARHKINMLVYVNLDQGNGGIIRDLSEYGVAVQAVGALRLHQHVRLRFELPNPRTRVDAVGHVAWANGSGQAGIQFTQIGQHTRQLLKDWLLMNLLATASYGSSAATVFCEPKASQENGELIFSGTPRPAIQLEASEPSRLDTGELGAGVVEEVSEDPFLEFFWWPVPMAARTFSHALDGLILLAAVLLFGVIFLAISHQMPPWPALVGVGITAVLRLFYWYIFAVNGTGTPGVRLARTAAGNAEVDAVSHHELARFR